MTATLAAALATAALVGHGRTLAAVFTRTRAPVAAFLSGSDSEPTMADFAVTTGPPRVLRYRPSDSTGVAAYAESVKPVLIYLPGIELSGYSAHRQYGPLSKDFDVRYLSAPTLDRTDFEGLVEIVRAAIEEAGVAVLVADASVAAEGAAAEETPSAAPAAPRARVPPPPRRPVFLAGESFGGVLALSVAASSPKPLAGLVLINPATGVQSSWAAQLPTLLDALAALPPLPPLPSPLPSAPRAAGREARNKFRFADAVYAALAAPIIGVICGDPLALGGRMSDSSLPPPLRALAVLGRVSSQVPSGGLGRVW